MMTILAMPLIEKKDVIWNQVRISLAINAEILSFQEFDGVVCMWVKYDTDDKEQTRTFFVFGPGFMYKPKEEIRFIGTCIFPVKTTHLMPNTYLKQYDQIKTTRKINFLRVTLF